MKIVFKVIAIIGILSFLGGLKDDVFFFFGLILAGIFGYFGWRPEKNLEDKKNSSDENNLVEKVTERRIELKTKTLNSQVESLKDLKEKGILTEEEYSQKVSRIEQEKKEENLKNSQEYKQLKSLFDSGILTNEEFESKLIVVSKLKTNKKLEVEKQVFEIVKIENFATFKEGRIGVFKIYNKRDEFCFYEIEKSKKVFISIKNSKKYFNNRNEFLEYFKKEHLEVL